MGKASAAQELSATTRISYAVAVGVLVFAVARFVQRRVLRQGPPAHVLSAPTSVYIRPVAPREQRAFTKEELASFNGVEKPSIYVSVKNVVFDVAPQLYGNGAPYHIYAGKEISRALAKSRVDDVLCNKDFVKDVTSKEMDTLDLWFKKFEGKYAVVGWYVPDDTYYITAPTE
ncbi:cytochrome-b5, putative [Bodo saltans]|uniref:Cytochrome-b5, putative n=1 Tax=Bodo saltans TaxID=75058 RepID=A0A0S4IWT4_BODSA|nr:cytochrome-b5, putative [Bodo saltans]|eukprot:CUG31274.1 cytochrome-b5, putative [Bodo saltans]